MIVMFQLSALALRQIAGPGSDAALNAFAERYGDRSTKLLNTLKSANSQAWKAVEIALAGSSWWDRAKRSVASGDQAAFRGQVQAFLEATPQDQLPGVDAEFRQTCLRELKAARRAGLLPGEEIPDPHALQCQAKALARFQDPRAVLDAEFDSIHKAAADLKSQGYENLGRLVALRPPGGRPLIVIAVEYFFRRDVLADPSLSAELQFHEFEKLSERQEAGFLAIHQAFTEQGERLENLLDSALGLLEETRTVTRETRDDVRILRTEMAQNQESLARMYQAVLELLQRPGVIPATASPVHQLVTEEPTEVAIAEMRELVAECQAIPGSEKRQHKALFRAVGKLKATVHAFDAKRRLRKNVLPSTLFLGEPIASSPPSRGDVELPFAEPFDESVTSPSPPALPQNGSTKVNSIFGMIPKSKIRRTKSEGGG